MAETKPLKLRQEKGQLKRETSKTLPYVKVLLDPPALHLDAIYDYSLPELLAEKVAVGSLVEVPFASQEFLGIVVERSNKPSTAGKIKQITRLLSEEPIVTIEQIKSFQNYAQKYGVQPWDFFAAAVPPYSKSGEKGARVQRISQKPASASIDLPKDLQGYLAGKELLKSFIELPIDEPYWSKVVQIIQVRASLGLVALVLPDEREIEIFSSALRKRGLSVLQLSSSQKKTERFENYMRALSGQVDVVLGTRNVVFTHLSKGSTLIVFEDQDESHYERRSPTWNTRQIALIRSEEVSVIFLGNTPSLEVADLSKRGWLKHYRFKSKLSCKSYFGNSDDDIDYFPIISRGLSSGSVLICVANTGYVKSFSCQKCRNIAYCKCGGKLTFVKSSTHPECSVCQTKILDWRCVWCSENKPRIISSGANRKAEEFGRSFPKNSTITSTGQNPVAYLAQGKNLVISTPGVEPIGQYSSILFLDLEQQFGRTELRSYEVGLSHILRILTLLKPGGEIYLSLPVNHDVCQMVTRQNTEKLIEREIAERNSAHLPPTYRLLSVDTTEAKKVIKALSDLPGIEIIGPIPRDTSERIIIKAKFREFAGVITRLYEINRVNSLRRKPLMRISVDPFNL